MTKKQTIQLFEEKKVRTVWDDEQEKWYFSIVDVCGVLTDSKDPTAYWRKLKCAQGVRFCVACGWWR